MRLLFVHDAERLKEDENGNLYTGGAYNSSTWDRYLSICSNLTVLFRKDTTKYSEKYAKSKFNAVDYKIDFLNVINRTDSVKSFFSIRKKLQNDRTIKRAVLENDHVIIRLPCSSGYTAIKYAKKYNKPYLVEVVGCVWDAYWNYNLKGKILALPAYLRMKRLVKEAPHVIYVTNEFLQNRYPTNGKNTNCSNVMLTEPSNTALENRIDKINKLDKGKIIIGTTAAIDVKYKGQQYVIEALGKLKKQGYKNFEYHLVGDGDGSYLESKAKENDVSDQVVFIGSLPHNKVFEWLDSIDLYVQPSRQEGLPRALIEAMSRGLPSFGANTAGIPELLPLEYVFSNTKNNVFEICEILRKFESKKMIVQANRNFLEAKKYEKNIIESRRREFFMDFLNDSQKMGEI